MIVECDDHDRGTKHSATYSRGGHCRFAILERYVVLIACLGSGR